MKIAFSNTPAAKRQRIYRRRIRQQLGKRPYTYYLTGQEAKFVRTSFTRKFGHQPTIRSARSCSKTPAAGPADAAEGRDGLYRPGQQMQLL
jgi:hypothetical protein